MDKLFLYHFWRMKGMTISKLFWYHLITNRSGSSDSDTSAKLDSAVLGAMKLGG